MTDAEYQRLLARLDNWGRSVGGRLYGQGHCRSIEYRCKPESFEKRRTPAPTVDHADAEEVEAAWRTMIDVRSKWFLRWYFVAGYSKQALCSRMRRKFPSTFRMDFDFDVMYHRAVRAIGLQLESKRAA